MYSVVVLGQWRTLFDLFGSPGLPTKLDKCDTSLWTLRISTKKERIDYWAYAAAALSSIKLFAFCVGNVGCKSLLKCPESVENLGTLIIVIRFLFIQLITAFNVF